MFATRLVSAIISLVVCVSVSSAQPIQKGGDKTPLVVKLDAVGLPDGAKLRLGKITGYRYTGQSGAALMSPDGKLLAVSDNNGNGILIIDAITGKILQRLQAQAFPGSGGMSFSPDGKSFAVESFGQDLKIWDVASGKLLKQLQHRNQGGGRQHGPSFSADGKIISVGGERFVNKNQEGMIKAWEVATGKEFGPFTSIHNYNIRAVVAPDGKTMISFGQYLNRGMGNDRDAPRTIQVWDLATGKEARKIMLELGPQGFGAVTDAAFAPDGKTLAVTSGAATFHLLEYDTGKETRRFSGQRGMGGSVLQYSPDGELLVVHDRFGGPSSVLQAWQIKSGKRIDLGDGPKASLMGVAFPGKNRITALGTLGQSLCWWDATADEKTAPFQGHLTQIAGLAFADAGNSLISAGTDQRVFWWDLASGKQTRELRLSDFDDGRYGYGYGGGNMSVFALAPNGRFAATSSNNGNGGVRLWNLKTGRAMLDLEGPQSHSMPGIAFSPDSTKLAATGTVFPFHIWNIETGQELPKMPGAKQQNNFGGGASSSAAFSPDGKTVAIHLNQFDRFTGQPIADLIFWDLANSKLMHRFKVPMVNNNFDGSNNSGNMAFSNDGALLAVSNGAGAIVLYSVASGKEWRKIDTTLRNSSFQLAFSPDGRFLAAGGAPRFLGGFGNIKMDEPTVEIWELAGSLRREQFKGHTGSITCLAYAPDGATIATGSTDTTMLLWDLTGKSGPKTSPLAAEELPQAWKTLTGNDPAAAVAIRRMIAAPEPTVAFLKKQFLPIKGEPLDEKALEGLVRNLDSGNFKTRTLATKELQRLGERAEAALRKALTTKPSVEMSRRIDELLEAMKRGNYSPAELQAMRGVEVLERIGTAEAREWLTALAQGDPIAQATREARGALKRMK